MSQNAFQKILVPLDGSTNSIRGLNAATSLARQSSGTITGLYVISSSGFSKAPSLLKKYRIELIKNAEKIMSQARSSVTKNGVEFDGKVITSPGIVRTIVGFAKSKRFDMVVMGSRGQSSPDAKYLGSVTNGVLNNLEIPVLIVK
jgi:nucleotide-binding universal stress UspA family protein